MRDVLGNGQLSRELRSIDNFLADARLCSELWFVYLIWHWILVFGTNPRLHFGEPYVDVQCGFIQRSFCFLFRRGADSVHCPIKQHFKMFTPVC